MSVRVAFLAALVLAALALVLWPVPVRAEGVVQAQATWCWAPSYSGAPTSDCGTSPSGACTVGANKLLAQWKASNDYLLAQGYYYVLTDGNINVTGASDTRECSGPGWQIRRPDGSVFAGRVFEGAAKYMGTLCPSDSTLTGPQCICNAGFDTTGTACVVRPPDCKLNEVFGAAQVYAVPSLTTFVCIAGCSARAQTAAADGAGKNWVWGPFIGLGETCTAGDAATSTPTAPAPDPAKPGECPGTVNGVTVYVPCKSTATGNQTKVDSPTPAASGASSAGTTSTRERTQTTCTDGVCTSTTTTTTTNPDGTSATAKKDDTKPQKTFCEENPNLSICKAGRFGGSCSAGFQCEGDGVQCAIARETFLRNCQLFEPSESSAIGLAAAAASAPALPASSVSFNLESRLSQVPLFGSSGGCPPDAAVSILGQSVALPFSRMCDSLAILAVAMKALALLVAALIVFRRS